MSHSKLRNEHCEAIVKIGSLSSDPIAIPDDVLEDLRRLEILQTFPDGHIDFTPAGEAIYEKLVASSGGS